MTKPIFTFLQQETSNLEQAGFLRQELPIAKPGPVLVAGKHELVNLVSADYLGLSRHAEVERAAAAALEQLGVGLGAPRPAGGTLPVHLELETALCELFSAEAAAVFPSGYHANTGVFESLLSERDYVFTDEQVNPSLADGVRLCRARVLSYKTGDLDHLEDRLQRARAARFRLIVTDAVFTLEGSLAKLRELYDLAGRYDALVVVDETHGLGVLGATGRGVHEHAGVLERLELVTGSFSAALGGAGGFVAGRRELVDWLRQKSRPYLTSSALPGPNAAAALAALRLSRKDAALREQLRANVTQMRTGLAEAGLRVMHGVHPIVCLRTGEALVTQRLVDFLYREGVYVMGFAYPVVPEEDARVRLSLSAAHGKRTLAQVLATFSAAVQKLRLA